MANLSARDTYLNLRAFVDELVRSGVRAACTSPGSRNAPLLLTLADDERLQTTSHIDERSGGFFALGHAKASRRPVVLACTSGTAAANYAPAVIEAFQARVPLIILSADRPPELREIGAGQTIDQQRIYGSAAKWFVEIDDQPASAERLRWLRQLACRAYLTATRGRPGPVHLNFVLREPLVLTEALPVQEPGDGGRADGRPHISTTLTRSRETGADAGGAIALLRATLADNPRAVIVAGCYERDPDLGIALAALAERFDIPLLADPLSGARRGAAAVAHYDLLLRAADWTHVRRPTLVIRFGDLPTSKPLRAWLAALDRETLQIAIDAESAWQNPDSGSQTILTVDPLATVRALAAMPIGECAPRRTATDPTIDPRATAPARTAIPIGECAPRRTATDPTGSDTGAKAGVGSVSAPQRRDWLSLWTRPDRRAAVAIDATLASYGTLTEPRVAIELGAGLPADATLVVASSMPIRDAETFFPVRDDPPRVLANRGANGIDGTTSTALGVAGAGDGPTVLLTGDVAFLHDLGGLIAVRRLGISLTIILVDNDGGGIFHFLPVADSGRAFEEYVATPHNLDFAHAANLFGLDYAPAADLDGFRTELDRALKSSRSTLIHIRTDRSENLSLHREIWDATRAGS